MVQKLGGISETDLYDCSKAGLDGKILRSVVHDFFEFLMLSRSQILK